MRSNDYYSHYKAFVKSLSSNPEMTLQLYCSGHDVVWRRLYDWMRRHRISLKRLYETYRANERAETVREEEEVPVFLEIMAQDMPEPIDIANATDNRRITISRIQLPGGIIIEMRDCPVSAMSVLLNQCLGKEVTNVCS